MTEKKCLFLFYGARGRGACSAFKSRLGALKNVEVTQPAFVGLVSARHSRSKPLDLEKSPDPGTVEFTEKDPINILAKSSSSIQIILVGDNSGIKLSDVKRLIRFFDPPQAPNLEKSETGAAEEARSEDENPDTTQPAIAQSKPAVEFTDILLPPAEIFNKKPDREIGFECTMYSEPNRQNWISQGYFDEDTLQKFSDTVKNVKALETELTSYQNHQEIQEVLSQTDFGADDIPSELTLFNRMVCDYKTSEVVLRLSSLTNSGAPIYIFINYFTSRHAAVILDLANSKNFNITRTEWVADAERFRVIFRAPALNPEQMKRLVEADFEQKNTLFVYHEINREFLEQNVFEGPVDLPFYDDNTVEELVEKFQSTNLIQELLEKKARFYSKFQSNQIERCISYLLDAN